MAGCIGFINGCMCDHCEQIKFSQVELAKFENNCKKAEKMYSSAERKNTPVFSGCMMYFPDALLEIAKHSKRGNDKHNPGQPLHWDRSKSKDQADCIARHLIDIGPDWDAVDPETGSLHATALAWRALALLQIVLEKKVANDQT